jgi:phosphatidylglycerol:prolipoprotein diacylglycerol transferase
VNSALIGSIGWPVIDRLHFGSKLAVSPHGLFIAVGFLLGAWWLLREGARRGLSVDHMNTMIFLALIGAVIGSRLFYVIAHYSEFNGIGDMIAIWRGGISLLGGIAGAVLINVPFMRKYGYRFFQVFFINEPVIVHCLLKELV